MIPHFYSTFIPLQNTFYITVIQGAFRKLKHKENRQNYALEIPPKPNHISSIYKNPLYYKQMSNVKFQTCLYSIMFYRNLRKPDPFQQVKRNIQLRLVQLQEAILSQYQPGQKRWVVQRAIRQLLNLETTTAGKIQKLITITQSLSLNDAFFVNQFDDCSCDLRTLDSQAENFNFEREKLFQKYRNEKLINQSTQYSTQTPSCKNDKILTEQTVNKQLNRQELIEVRSSLTHSLTQSSNPPFSKFSSRKIQKEQHFSGYSEQESSNQSNILKSEQGLQKGLFSFRTQQHEHDSGLYVLKKSQLKQSRKKIDNNSSKSKEKQSQQQMNKQLNSDGHSERFVPHSSRLSNEKQDYQLTKKSSQIYKKINNRIRVSGCVVNKIKHGSSSANTFHLLNKYNLQKDGRSDIIKDIINAHNNVSIWK